MPSLKEHEVVADQLRVASPENINTNPPGPLVIPTQNKEKSRPPDTDGDPIIPR